ncbi:TlpA disulfide reductase family protein [Kangiella koreensis]|uniref:Redoxin domain protein n=1 Tax=Kangiella koreensis (strain DSM 16069 / JCM 12317 / KCTC 12182 / SW-125) TaxID=523791 RepID=C7R7D6_KANKD|nr:TlpA disulfide reductase family protein [Kangiella koreensis]ACV25685.1 Redoxin domain protein [Kangiella koreensis DSM 16069]
MRLNIPQLFPSLLLLAVSSLGSSIATANDAGQNNDLLEQLNLEQYHGKVVYVDFWASWCGPCRQSFPVMNELQKTYGEDNFVIIAINEDSEPGAAKQFLEQYPASFTIFYDQDGELAKYFKVDAMPTSYLLDQAGTAKYRHRGFHQKDVAKLEQQIETLLSAQSFNAGPSNTSNSGDTE